MAIAYPENRPCRSPPRCSAALLQAVPTDLTTRRRQPRISFRRRFTAPGRRAWSNAAARSRVLFDATTYRSPDNLATLIRHIRVRPHPPGGQRAITLVAQVEVNSEGQISRGQVRISRAGPYLYLSNPELVGDREHWRMRNVRCPD